MWKYYEWFSEVLWLPRNSFIVWFSEGVDRQNSGMWFSSCYQNTSWVFSLGDFVLESLFCAQRLWILNLFSADTELWASRFDWLKDYNFWTFQMLFISSQNPVTSAREIYRLLPAIYLSLLSFSKWLLTALHSTYMTVKLLKWIWNFFSHVLANPDRYITILFK